MSDDLKFVLIGTYKLHRLALEGKNDSEEADRIRDPMESVWYRLSADEKRRDSEFSIALNFVEDYIEAHPGE